MTRRISLKRLRRMYARRRLGGAVQELHPEGPSIRKIPSLGVHDHEDRRVHGFYSGGWRWRERERQVGYVGGYKEGEGTFSHDPANSDLCWCACLVWHVSKSGKVVDVFSL
jgi:hypothetical protein